MNVHEFMERYRTTSLKSFIGNSSQKECIMNFLNRDIRDIAALSASLQSTSRFMLLIGQSGSGKTTFINSAIAESKINHSTMFVSYDGLTCHKDLTSLVENFVYTKTMTEFFEKKTKLLIFDDIEILFAQDRYAHAFIQNLLTDLTKSKDPIKVIITCSLGEEKKTTDIKKRSDIIRLHNPSPKETKRYISDILINEGWIYDEVLLDTLIKNMQCNIRNIITNIESVVIEQSSEDAELQESRIYFDNNIYDLVEKIFHNPQRSLIDLEIAISCDPTLCSFMMYDNFKPFFDMCYKLPKIDEPGSILSNWVGNIYNSYVDASKIEENAYRNSDWTLMEIANVARCGVIRLAQREFTQKPDVQLSDFKVTYTQITTRAAQHHNIEKKLDAISSYDELSRDNIMFLGDMVFEKKKQKTSGKTTVREKDEITSLLTTYMNNICSKTNKIYLQRMICVKKVIKGH